MQELERKSWVVLFDVVERALNVSLSSKYLFGNHIPVFVKHMTWHYFCNYFCTLSCKEYSLPAEEY